MHRELGRADNKNSEAKEGGTGKLEGEMVGGHLGWLERARERGKGRDADDLDGGE